MEKLIRNFLIAGAIFIVGWFLFWAILTATANPFDDGTSGTFEPISTEVAEEFRQSTDSIEVLPTKTPEP